jgi:hypothetical protein
LEHTSSVPGHPTIATAPQPIIIPSGQLLAFAQNANGNGNELIEFARSGSG